MFRTIRAELTYHEMRVEDLAKEMGISAATLSNKLNGHKKWWLHEAKQVVDILNKRGDRTYTIEELFGELFA